MIIQQLFDCIWAINFVLMDRGSEWFENPRFWRKYLIRLNNGNTQYNVIEYFTVCTAIQRAAFFKGTERVYRV